MDGMKTCPRCETALPLDAFARDGSKRDGCGTYCKPCQKIRHGEWRASHRDRSRACGRRRYAAMTPEQRRAHNRKNAAIAAERYRADPTYRARVLADQAARYAANPTPKKAAAKAWSRAHPDSMIESAHRRRARIREVAIGPVNRRRVMERDAWVCWICHEPTEPDGPRGRRPSLDHVIALVDGGGHTEDNLRCAHVGCNSSRFNRGRSRPHRQKVA